MEQNQSLFSLSIDPVTKAHLSEAARWARFLAIVGFIFLAIMVIAGLFLSTFFASSRAGMGDEYGGNPNMFAGLGVGIAIIYILGAILWFFPLLYMYRFSNKMRAALAGNDQEALNTSFQNLKICYRYLGILTIIVLAIYVIALLFGILGAAAFA